MNQNENGKDINKIPSIEVKKKPSVKLNNTANIGKAPIAPSASSAGARRITQFKNKDSILDTDVTIASNSVGDYNISFNQLKDYVMGFFNEQLIGTVQVFLTTNLPDGFFELNGDTVAWADAPLLGAKVSGTEGFTVVQDVSITLPDLSGYFLRYNRSNPLGTLQEDAFQNIYSPVGNGAPFTNVQYSFQSLPKNSNKAFYSPGTQTFTMDTIEPAPSASAAKPSNNIFDTSNDPSLRTDTETRPKNVSVIYAIKGR